MFFASVYPSARSIFPYGFVCFRCPLKKQNYDYAHYLLTAVFHESWVSDSFKSGSTTRYAASLGRSL